MTKRELSKLQVRAEVLAVLQQLSALDETSRDNQLKLVKRLYSIANVDYVLECLLRELPKNSYEVKQVIAQLLLELGSLEKLSNPLWNIIKDPNIPDEAKDIANAILRNLGDPSEADAYLQYLNDPQELIDKETERMLMMATLNPESQIDFLDFLFSLPEAEQINLINSLKDDYPGEYLSCIFIPAIDAMPSDDVFNLLVNTLGNSRSSRALKHIDLLNQYCEDEDKKKILKKNYNLLKLSGASFQKTKTDQIDINKDSKIFKCFASPIDGVGNQGIIFSRLKSNQDISLFSVVVNDTQGIIDCFGFYQITLKDFERIINKFQEGIPRNNISPEYCKTRICASEEINRTLGLPIPYEYTCWKTLASDIETLDADIEEVLLDIKDDLLTNQINKLYNLQDFSCWFFENDDHPGINDFFSESILSVLGLINSEKANASSVSQAIDSQIANHMERIFDDFWKNLMILRLGNQAYLLHETGLKDEAALVSTAFYSLTEESNIPLKENAFLKQLLRKSIAEYLLRLLHTSSDKTNNQELMIAPDKLETIQDIINDLYDIWKVDF